MVKKRDYKDVSPDIQHSIVAKYFHLVRGCGRDALAAKYNHPNPQFETSRPVLMRKKMTLSDLVVTTNRN